MKLDVLLTGATGLIGGEIAWRLMKSGRRVWSVVRAGSFWCHDVADYVVRYPGLGFMMAFWFDAIFRHQGKFLREVAGAG